MPSKIEKPFPLRQLLVLALCRLGEPIAFMSVFPYVYYMIASFKITEDDRQISMYAGMVTSAFAFAEFASGTVWGRISDRIGRKPVLLGGLFGTALSMLVFGFARSLPVALFARALGGLLNGNIGVIQTTVAELVTVKEHQPRAYTYMPLTWCIGSILGSFLGGALANPVEKYPNVFSSGTIFESYPFLLPNLVATVFSTMSLLIGLLFLEETHAEKKSLPDRGLQVGSWLLRKLHLIRETNDGRPNSRDDGFDEHLTLLSKGSPPRSQSSRPASPGDTHVPKSDLEARSGHVKRGFFDGFTKQVNLHIIAYALLALHTVTMDQLLPIMMGMKESHKTPSLPFKFDGGFQLSSSTVGVILSLQAVYNGFYQLLLAPMIMRKFGSVRVFRCVALTMPLLYFIMPYLVLLPRALHFPALAVVYVWKVSTVSLAYLSIILLLTNSAPSLLVLGTINGVASSGASLARAIGPTLFGYLYSVGLENGYSGLAWWINAGIAIIGAVECFWQEEPEGRFSPVDEHSEHDCGKVLEQEQAVSTIPEAPVGGLTLLEEESLEPADAAKPARLS